ncbi:3-oxoacyl-ACP reductase [Parendozoicomonas haliclonae]|uniref:3-oxoacyl-[acyl-carrier-protein] reductase FabG n=1 Tax=Parendozoicomonas haliclonae TaxID=1960125 RepID=A0A1X7AHR3_9GAMM|nr:3-oxoacyl-ACP reductase [Parendozoicomonas haliclonae]SMA42336.1 3-oxoacyl-[acyl-carrier-protein] reductase FabG [Parendozoicomonas haliclonae]
MSDRYQKIATSPMGKSLFSALGLPTPVTLDRQAKAEGDFLHGKVLVGAASGSTLLGAVTRILANSSAEICCQASAATASDVVTAAEKAGKKTTQVSTGKEDSTRFKALVFDATGISSTAELRALHDFFSPVVKKMENSGRIVVLGTPMAECDSVSQAAAMRSLEGFTRSLGKEVGKKGTTVQLVYVSKGVDAELDSPLRFCLSPRSAYVSAQVLQVGTGKENDGIDWSRPLDGKVVLVTGASRGIGEAIAEVMARDGAKVVCLDVPQAAAGLEKVATRIGGSVIAVDITAADAPKAIADALEQEFGGVDVVVHNAGVTRDKTLGNMKADWWDMVIDINLSSEERINDELLARNLLRDNGRIVCVSSMSGIAGNFGQTNYAVSKAGVIGYVQAMAAPLAEKNITINAVAPGFIETQMTAAIPLMTREVGRRMNSLSQGGQPQDVAEAIAFFASPASVGVNGNVIRVCGQSLLGA